MDREREKLKLEILHGGSFKLMLRFMFRIKLYKTIQRLITTVMKGYSFTQQFLRVLKYHFVLGIVNFPVTPEALLYFSNGNIKLIVQSNDISSHLGEQSIYYENVKKFCPNTKNYSGDGPKFICYM